MLTTKSQGYKGNKDNPKNSLIRDNACGDGIAVLILENADGLNSGCLDNCDD